MADRRADAMTDQTGQSGLPEATPPAFDLSGGKLCLNFTNTVEGRATEPRELLRTYQDLVEWARQAGAIDAETAARLARRAELGAGQARAAVRLAVGVREALFEVLLAAARGESAPALAVEAVNAQVAKMLARRRLEAVGPRFEWRWQDEPVALDRVLWPVLASAVEILTSDDLARVRECAADTCVWLFFDGSRNRSRRWCDMSVCGNRDKVRRHYHRKKAR